MTDSAEVPLSVAFVPDVDPRITRLAERIRSFIGVTAPPTLERAREAVRGGQHAEAIKLRREVGAR